MISFYDITKEVNKHHRVLEAIFEKRANIAWSDIESMLLYYGAEISEGRGSRVRIALHGVRAVFHHPQKRPTAGQLPQCEDSLWRQASELRGNYDLQGLSSKSGTG